MAAGILIVREAGGRVGRLEGAGDIFAEGTLLAGNPEIYGRLEGLLVQATPELRDATALAPLTPGPSTD